MVGKEKSIITIVGAYFPRETGFSIAFQNLHRALLEQKVVDKIYVLAPEEADDPDLENIKVLNLLKFPFPQLVKGLAIMHMPRSLLYFAFRIQLQKVKKEIERIQATSDVKLVLIESMYRAWMVPFIKKNFNIPTVVRIHGTGPEYTKYFRERDTNLYREELQWTFNADGVAATTSFYWEFFQTYWNDYNHFMGKSFFVIPNTVNIQYEKHIPKDQLVLFQLGRMNRRGYFQKGFNDTIQALYYLEEKLPQSECEKIRLISVGSGEFETEFKRLLEGLRWIKYEHHSALPNEKVRETLVNADVVLMPSRCEGMSMFATEALATGKAFIFTRNNGLKDIILDKYNGLAIDSLDYLALASHIETFLKRPELVDEFSLNSRKLFEREFTYEMVAKKFSVMLRTMEQNHSLDIDENKSL